MNKNCKIAMITMFKNESRVMRRMLESCAPYIDFWVIQNNGSTDGTDQIVRDFFEEVKIPGVLYDVEEGWVGFGWNRDHLIRTCQSIDHDCDWILKMDCDETLFVDSSFDWSILDNKSVQAWHVPTQSGPFVYHRAWMYNANLPWRFDHDPCHETVYCDNPEIGHKFQTVDLPKEFIQIGYNEGQSWSNPTKFISDSLILEEKMIREGTIFSDQYHFYYIGKSYADSYQSDALPLGLPHKYEYARRTIFYLEQYVNFISNGVFEGRPATHPNEMCYTSLVEVAAAYRFIKNYEKCIQTLKLSEQFAPERNDHFVELARTYEMTKDYHAMLEMTKKLVDPNRKNPFPTYTMFINVTHYIDGDPSLILELHRKAENYVNSLNPAVDLPFYINKHPDRRLFIVDNFYKNPDQVREYAMSMEFSSNIQWYKGLRSTRRYLPKGLKEAFEYIIGQRITTWDEGMNGVFQITTADDQQVYHHDEQKWAAMIYLTPNAPYESGTRLHRSKLNGAYHMNQGKELIDQAFSNGFYDSTKFHTVDSAGNVYNRLVIMDAQHIHSAGNYFGNSVENGRLVHLFFFN